MNYVITSGKTVEVAVEIALAQLDAKREDVSVEVIEEASKGLFGLIGTKEATVKVSIKEDPIDIVKQIFGTSEEKPKERETVVEEIKVKAKSVERTERVEKVVEPTTVKEEIKVEHKVEDFNIEDKTKEFLSTILNEMGIDYSLDIKLNSDILNVEILSEEPEKLGVVIGKRGVTLDSLQYLLSVIVNKNVEDRVKIVLDSNDYRKKRELALVSLANKMAKKAKKYKNKVKLEPMNPYERRIIHSTLHNVTEIKTYSEGKDPYRRVVIAYDRDKK